MAKRLSLESERLDVHEAMVRKALVAAHPGWTLTGFDDCSRTKTKHYDFIVTLTNGRLTRRVLVECKTDNYAVPELPVEVWTNIPRANILPQVLVWPKGEGLKERRARHEYITSHVRSLLRWHFQSGGSALDTAKWERGLSLARLDEVCKAENAQAHFTSYLKTHDEQQCWYGIDTPRLQARVASHYPLYPCIIGRNEGHKTGDWFSMCAKVTPSRDCAIWLPDCYSLPVPDEVLSPSVMVALDMGALK